MKFRARLEKGRLVYQKELVQAYLSRFKEGDVFKCDITRPQRRHSDPLRRYFFGVAMKTACEHFGYEKTEALWLHEQLKAEYFNCKPDNLGLMCTPSVFSKNSKKPVSEKQDYVEWVKRKFATYGCYIPDPNE